MKKWISYLLILSLLMLPACKRAAEPWQEQFDLGIKYLTDGNYEEAILAFTAVIEIDPNLPDAYVGRGDAYVGASDAMDIGQPRLDYLQSAERDYATALKLAADGHTMTADPAEVEQKLAETAEALAKAEAEAAEQAELEARAAEEAAIEEIMAQYDLENLVTTLDVSPFEIGVEIDGVYVVEYSYNIFLPQIDIDNPEIQTLNKAIMDNYVATYSNVEEDATIIDGHYLPKYGNTDFSWYVDGTTLIVEIRTVTTPETNPGYLYTVHTIDLIEQKVLETEESDESIIPPETEHSYS